MRVQGLRRRLLAWYDRGRRPLPWRFPQHAADPYRVWIAEVMSQQTRVAVAAPYYERFVARFPSLEALAGAREDEVLALWSGLGYYARARRLGSAAREALRRHGGLPASLPELLELPGFGPYTAGAVASIAFALPVPAVDGNVTRVLARIFAVDGPREAAASRARILAHAAALARGRRPGDVNQALMELGATVCLPRSPACPRCPAASLCVARAAGREGALPATGRRKPSPRVLELACAILRRGEEILLVRRPSGGLFGGLWSPPSFEVPRGEEARAVLAAGLRTLGLRCVVGEEMGACERALTHRRLVLRAFRCVARSSPPRGGPAWKRPSELDGLGVPSAMRALLARLELSGTPRGAQDRESA